jgi:hypothetical protein
MILFSSCQKYYVAVRQVPVGPDYLASVHVNTPDYRKENPPVGQKLVIDWTVPIEVLEKKPHIDLYLFFRNHTEKKVSYPIELRNDSVVYSLLNDEYKNSKGLLTYRAEIVTDDGTVYREWKHQLWVKLLTVESIETPKAESLEEKVLTGSAALAGSVPSAPAG